ncbi:MAG: M28 family peptidase [Tannerellaceae bacterium]|jgi:Zn-dependent M28 family amino/carboxypeptidase|nr:M28 family peptidase [Tannerellaceae bacterium]
MNRIFAISLILLFSASVARPQVGDALTGKSDAPEKNSLSDEALFRKVISELSDDKFGGRKPMSAHEAPVLDYIATQFKSLGLEPAANGSFYQKVPLLGVKTHIKNNVINVRGAKGSVRLRYWDDAVVWTHRAEKKLKVSGADFVFAGFGINAPEYGWNDYDGIDVKGKIVVVMVNDPGYYDDNLFRGKNMTYYGRWTYKFEEGARQGAAAVIIIHDTAPASYGWSVVQNSRASSSLCLYDPDGGTDGLLAYQGWVTGEAAAKLFAAAGASIDDALSAAKRKGFKSFPLKLNASIESTNDVEIGESANVAAVLPGSVRKDECIIYSAHWDHLGIGQAVDGDSIYNGADDNASGVAALILLARRFSKLPRPERSILFLSVTGEESGLLGSDYYVRHPLYPLDKTAICLNMDGYGDKMRTSNVVLSAAGQSETDRYVIEAAAAQGRHVTPSTSNSGGGYYRSDHFNFAKKGVPVVLAKGGQNYLDPQAAKAHRENYNGKSTYHQPSDEYHEWWDVSGSLDDIYLFYGIGLRLANDGYFPQWLVKVF